MTDAIREVDLPRDINVSSGRLESARIDLPELSPNDETNCYSKTIAGDIADTADDRFGVFIVNLSGEKLRIPDLHATQTLAVLHAKVVDALDHIGGVQLLLGDQMLRRDQFNLTLGSLSFHEGSEVTYIRFRNKIYEYLGDIPPLTTEWGPHWLRRKHLQLCGDDSCRLVEVKEEYTVKAFVVQYLYAYYGTYEIDDNFVRCHWMQLFTQERYCRIGDEIGHDWRDAQLDDSSNQLSIDLSAKHTHEGWTFEWKELMPDEESHGGLLSIADVPEQPPKVNAELSQT
eukprot:gnl/MRDRNA2_/MRDRNA2_49729_c0_seq2.p1 gnl/MRDRNA2_/MRDRNA2_49729_c0~~gnl/MRDRNA2_/MRDRNA2_49729_c0_seq2.p1  ORF type:complete len:316 (-),score=66.24 gnl/MRDRNA2_/MRDRNA2_49729_c0_seq2:200-1057(-)